MNVNCIEFTIKMLKAHQYIQTFTQEQAKLHI
jgi:hypothetical protein